MSNSKRPIEEFFLESILKLSLIGILVVMVVDYYFNQFTVLRSVIVNGAVLTAILSAFFLYKKGYFLGSVLLIGFMTMGAMFYQSIEANTITTSSMAVVMVIGFGFSVLLKGKLPLFLHTFTMIGMIVIFVWLSLHPHRYSKPDASDIIIAGVTYLILYILIAFSSLMLKQRYDEAFETMAVQNLQLIEKSNEIETQNEELVLSQENLHNLNIHLEKLVEERTREVQRQNEQLIRYAYSNAHHVRGPVARLLGLIQLSKMESDLDYAFIFEKIEEQANEIDDVVKGINRELEAKEDVSS
jgi:signal transduction histidine kinase